jgi:hypothetical protein
MARYVSHIRGLQLVLVSTAARYSNYGDRIVDREGYTAVFAQGDVTERDLEFAEKAFAGKIRGRTTEMDEVTLSPLMGRISVFDTDEKALEERWTAEFKQTAEQKLSALAETSEEFAQIVETPAEAPWPNYLDYEGTLESLLAKIASDGYDFAEVLRFEQQLPAKRPILIEALERKVAEQDELLRGVETVNA